MKKETNPKPKVKTGTLKGKLIVLKSLEKK